MIPSPATPGTIGQLLSLHLVAAIYARRLNKTTPAAVAAHAGAKMLKKFTIKSTEIKKFHDEWCRANGYKPSSTVTQGPKPQAKGGPARLIPKSTSSRIREPGYKRTSWSRAQATRTKVFFLCLMWKDIWCGENRTKLGFLGGVTFNSRVKKLPLGA